MAAASAASAKSKVPSTCRSTRTGGYGKRNAKLVVAFEFICRFLRVARSRSDLEI